MTQSQNEIALKNSLPAKVMFIGGITNIIFSPLFAIIYKFVGKLEGRVMPEDPFWVWSFYFCTTVFGLAYIQVSRSPIRAYPFFPVILAAKCWGVCAIIYALFKGYPIVPIAGLYDLFFIPFFITLFVKTKRVVKATE